MVENANENQETSAKKRGRKPGSIKNKDKEKNNNKKIQPRIRTTRNSNKVLMTVLTFFMLLKFMLCSSISGVFYYCQELNHQVTLDLHHACKPFTGYDKIVKKEFKASILSKDSNVINGLGVRCKKTHYFIKTYMNPLFFKSHKIIEESIKLTPGECQMMKVTKLCEKQRMSCKGNMCFYKSTLNYEYSYLVPIKYDYYDCFIEETQVIGEHENSTLFQDSDCVYSILHAKDTILS